MTTTSRPRRASPAPAPRVQVLPRPPAAPDPTAVGGLLQVVLPAMGGLGMVLFLIAGRNALMLIAGMIMLVVTVGGAIGMAVTTRFGPRRRFVQAREQYLEGLTDVRGEIREETRRQRRHDDDLHPDPVALFGRVLSGTVCPRSRTAPESSRIRIGAGALPHPVRIDLPEAEGDPVTNRAMESLAHAYRVLPSAPLLLDLTDARIHLLGDLADTRAVIRGVLLQAAAALPPESLRLTVLTHEPREYAWARWLPHLQGPDGTTRIGPDLQPPEQTGYGTRPDGRPVIGHLLVVEGEQITVAGEGTCLIRLSGAEEEGVGIEVAVAPGGAAVQLSRDGVEYASGRPDVVDAGFAESTTRAVAARHGGDDRVAATTGVLAPARVLGVDRLEDFDPARSWRPGAPPDLLTVPVGCDADGEEVRLDLKESGHGGVGPHGLLVGATGSGKSELLRSIVLGLAATHHPDDLAFVLVDYKGGATFAGLERLPHVAGVVTNLGDDLGLVDRMHTALSGEITRRQQVLHDSGRLSDVYAHREARRRGEVDQPLPHLLVVVDEFAELLTATPDLLDLFTTIGRIGRSIGVHQLLASQRLDDGRLRGLEAFLSYRFALRTFTPEESRAVIGSTLAAELPVTPGGGYLRTVETTRFQAAYVSGPAPDPRPVLPDRVQEIDWFGSADRPRASATAEASTRPGPPPAGAGSLLATAVDLMAAATERTRPVWLPPLPERLVRSDLDGLTDLGDAASLPFVARIGLVDLPAEQRVAPLDLDLRGGSSHLVVLGGPDSGRSSTLRALVHALAERHGPEHLLVHAVDLDGDSLRPLEDLPQVGSVAGRREEELTRRILADVVRTIDLRADAGPAGPTERPELLLLVDGYTTLRASEDVHEQVVAVATRGADLGVHLVLTASRWHDLRPALQTSLHTRLELRLGEPMDSVVDRRLSAHLSAAGPGRALVDAGRPAQIVLPGDGIDERATYRRIAARHERRARPVALLPRDLRFADLHLPDRAASRWWIGVSEQDLRPVGLGEDAPHLLVVGDRRSGRTSLLRSLVQQSLADPTSVIAVIDPRRTLLDDVPADRLAGYVTHAAGAHTLVASLVTELETRSARLTGADPRRPADAAARPSRILLVVDDAELVIGGLNPLAPLEPFLATGADIGFSLVLARHCGGAARALYDPVLQRIKELGCPGVLLSGDAEEGPLWPGAALRPLPPGRAVLARRGQAPTLIHLARP
ncbi:type VII secretion protein EccCa [Mobilicoccus caccae]|uniref:Type VII secretion protein EccC n=1 Tax=Mobilicoccus caccae TaxID=1859295 RepID=A0ABQ6IN27_9MICO|nr:type VII secretion protein EccCa [Mobilicoccus caccae]GMA39342.1 type VII secretion protein EccC [Mobilicoccus caccae]